MTRSYLGIPTPEYQLAFGATAMNEARLRFIYRAANHIAARNFRKGSAAYLADVLLAETASREIAYCTGKLQPYPEN